jgi:HK97 family phage major capsid protein
MNKSKLLQAKAVELDAMKAIQAAAANRDLTDEERAQFDAHKAKVETLNTDLERVLTMEAAERSPAQSAARVDVAEAGKKPFANLGEQLNAIRTATLSEGRVTDPRLIELNRSAAAQGANEGVPAEGGFLVAPEFSSTILQRIYDTGQIASRCYQQPMSTNRLVLPAVDEDSRADGSRWGGVQAYWEGEAGTYTGTKPKFRTMELIANKLIALVYLTEELQEDAPALEAYCNKVVPQEIEFKFDDAILNGPGAGMPLGILTSNAPVVVAKDGGQTANTVTSSNILNMWKRLYGRSRMDAAWFINQDIESQLYTLAFTNPTGAVLFTGPMYTPPGVNGNNSGYGLLIGRPVIPVEQCATLGTQGDIVLADCSQYTLGKKGGVRADQSIHVAFLTGEVAFRWMIRAAGQPSWKKPLTPYKGANTLSPFVTLATRG